MQNYYNTMEDAGLFQFGNYEYSSPCLSIGDFSDVSSSAPLFSNVCLDDSLSFQAYVGHLPFMVPMQECFQEANAVLDDQLMITEVEDVSDWLVSQSSLPSQQDSVEDSQDMSPMSSEASTADRVHGHQLQDQTSLVLPGDDMEVDDQLSILHLLKAYGEAMEMEVKELADEIMRRLKEKACPTGSILHRLVYYLIQAVDKQVDFLRVEAGVNYEAAFRAFYQIFPYGRFAHFAANSVILESIPQNTEAVHIVDFDIGNGVQWPPLIEALARQGHRSVRLTAIKWEEEETSFVPPTPSFEETKMRLHEHAKTLGLRLKLEEMDMAALVNEMKRTKKRGGRSEWLAFNCMVGLPHMGKDRSARSVMEFLKVAKDSVNLDSHAAGSSSSRSCRGTITFGDGVGWDKGMKGSWNGYGSLFEEQLVRFQALLQSLDSHFPHHLRDARIAMECLFLIPYISTLCNQQMWEDVARESNGLSQIGLEGCRISEDCLFEARELVREGESCYSVIAEGSMENQAVLTHLGKPLVKVSSWIGYSNNLEEFYIEGSMRR